MIQETSITHENDCSKALLNEIVKPNKKYAVVFFNTEIELGISNIPNKWVCSGIRYFDNGVDALNCYANTPNPASQLIDGENDEELENNIERIKINFKNQNWLEENLYPYI